MTIVAIAVGVVAGCLYTLSPMTFWFGAGMILLFAWAGRGIEGRERRWLFGLLGTAVALRLLALVAFFFMTQPMDGTFPVLIPDEEHIALRTRLLRYAALDVPLGDPEYMVMAEQWADTGLHQVLAYLQLQLGDAPYGIRLFSVALYLIATAVMYRTARLTFGRMAALGGLAIVLFLPSMFVWSISTLKEPVHQFLIAVAVSASIALVRATSPAPRARAAAGVVAALLVIAYVRPGTHLMVAGGIAAGFALAGAVRRPVIAACAIVLCVLAAPYWVRSPAVRERAVAMSLLAIRTHVGYVETPGRNYKVLDPDFYWRDWAGNRYSNDPAHVTPGAMARYAVRAIASFVFVPLPWMASSPALLIYLPEQMAWYSLVILAVSGITSGVRKDLYLTMVLVGVTVISAGVIAITGGNIGTLVRHRSLVLVVLPWLSALGACAALKRFARRWPARAPDLAEVQA